MADDTLQLARDLSNACLSAFFSADKPKAREQRSGELLTAVDNFLTRHDYTDNGGKAVLDAAQSLRAGAHPTQPFHWKIDFPEVFHPPSVSQSPISLSPHPPVSLRAGCASDWPRKRSTCISSTSGAWARFPNRRTARLTPRCCDACRGARGCVDAIFIGEFFGKGAPQVGKGLPLRRKFCGAHGDSVEVILYAIAGYEEATGEFVGFLLDPVPRGAVIMHPSEECAEIGKLASGRFFSMQKIVAKFVSECETKALLLPDGTVLKVLVGLGVNVNARKILKKHGIHAVLREQIVEWNNVQPQVEFGGGENVHGQRRKLLRELVAPKRLNFFPDWILAVHSTRPLSGVWMSRRS